MDTNGSETTLDNGEKMPQTSDGIQEPIAIVGIAFKFPQGAESESSLWEKLMNQECTSTEWPKDRLNIDGFWNPDPKKMNTVRLLKSLVSCLADDLTMCHADSTKKCPLPKGRYTELRCAVFRNSTS
jgi:hypothetical protein